MNPKVNPRKPKYLFLSFVVLFYLFSTAYIFYIGRYETLYGAGVSGVLVIQALGFLVFGVSLLLSKYKVRLGFYISALAVSSIQLAFIITHEIDHYQPTYIIDIPPNYEGVIYLFVTNTEKSHVSVDEHGVGYMGSKGKAKWKIRRGNLFFSEALETSQNNEIILRDSANTVMTVYDVTCLTLNNSHHNPTRISSTEGKPCMDNSEFLELVKRGVILEKMLQKKVWRGNGDESSWVFDSQNSKL